MEIHNAWVVFWPRPGMWAVAGPFATSEEAHAESIPKRGMVVFNCEDDADALVVAKRRIDELAKQARIGSMLCDVAGEKEWHGCLN